MHHSLSIARNESPRLEPRKKWPRASPRANRRLAFKAILATRWSWRSTASMTVAAYYP
jgi:hypothetical protein